MTVRMSSMSNDSKLIGGNGGGGGSGPSNSLNNANTPSQNPMQAFNWFFDKSELKRTPSFFDGISYERERRYRNEGSRFILNCGSLMKLRYNTLATGVVYFHRFYMFHSFNVFPRYVTAACCLFLAGKAEETPKKCKDIIKIAKTMIPEEHFKSFGEDPKEEVLTMERIVLQTIRFDLQVEHPYNYLIDYAKCFKGDRTQIQQVLQMAWTFTNDSLSTTLSLQWEPEIVAIAMIFLACKIKYEIPDWEGRLSSHRHWWDMYVEDLSVSLLEDICHQVLDLYSDSHFKGLKDGTNVSVASPLQNQPPTLPTLAAPATPVAASQPRLPPPVQTPPVSALNSSSLSSMNSLYPPPPPPPPPPAVPAAASGGGGQFRFNVTPGTAVGNTSVLNNAAAIAPPPPTLPPQWDPALAPFYQNFSLVSLSATAAMSGQVIPSLPLPPPPPPPIQLHGLAQLGRLPATSQPQQPPPSIGSFKRKV